MCFIKSNLELLLSMAVKTMHERVNYVHLVYMFIYSCLNLSHCFITNCLNITRHFMKNPTIALFVEYWWYFDSDIRRCRQFWPAYCRDFHIHISIPPVRCQKLFQKDSYQPLWICQRGTKNKQTCLSKEKKRRIHWTHFIYNLPESTQTEECSDTPEGTLKSFHQSLGQVMDDKRQAGGVVEGILLPPGDPVWKTELWASVHSSNFHPLGTLGNGDQ